MAGHRFQFELTLGTLPNMAMRRAMANIGVQAIPLVILLLRPWSIDSRFASTILIGFPVSLSIGVLAWSLQTRKALAIPIGWAVLVSAVAGIRVAEEFVDYVNLYFVYLLLLFSLAGGFVLVVGGGRCLFSVDPAVRLDGGLLNRVAQLAYRFSVPALISTPLVWLVLNQFRRVSYDAENPNAFHSYVIAAQDYVGWAALALIPIACGVTVAWIFRRIRSQDGRATEGLP
jgi:hypothetical protein